MALKYKITELFRNRLIVPNKLYDQLQEIDRQITEGADAVPIVKQDVKLNKSSLKKEFGDPKKFVNIGIVHNSEGSYLIVADDKGFKCTPLDNI